MFSESPRFPDKIAYGAVGGPAFKTLVSINDAGYEQRLARWQYPLHTYDVSQGAKNQADIDTLKQFFMNKQGMLTGFRFKDWSDFDVITTESSMVYSALGVLQLGKIYTSGSSSTIRDIKKVVDTTYSIYRNSTLQTEGSSAGNYSIDITTGIVVFKPDLSGSITGATNASPCVITDAGHSLTTGDEIEIKDVIGMTELNGNTYTVTVINSSTFSIGIDSTSYGSYAGGGAWEKYIQSSDVMTWSGEFDVPVRFGSDNMQISIIDSDIMTWAQIPLVELR